MDFLTFLAGGVPIAVTAQALPDNGKYHQDNLSMTFTFPDGSVGVVDYLAGGDRSFPKERLESCFNPLLEDRRRRKRESLLAATEKQFARIAAAVFPRRVFVFSFMLERSTSH